MIEKRRRQVGGRIKEYKKHGVVSSYARLRSPGGRTCVEKEVVYPSERRKVMQMKVNKPSRKTMMMFSKKRCLSRKRSDPERNFPLRLSLSRRPVTKVFVNGKQANTADLVMLCVTHVTRRDLVRVDMSISILSPVKPLQSEIEGIVAALVVGSMHRARRLFSGSQK